MDIISSTPNFDYYDMFNSQFDITNNFSPPYQMVSVAAAAAAAAASSSSSSTGLSASEISAATMFKDHNGDHDDDIFSINSIHQYQSIATTISTNDYIINSNMVDGSSTTTSTSSKIRNPVDPNLAFWAVVDGVLLVFILGGNFLTIVAVRFSRRLRSITSNLFVLSLAISDILVGFTLPYHLAFYMGSGLGKTKEYCLLRFFLIILACCNSIWNLIAIAVDRYIAIFFPLHYSRYMTKKVALILLGFGWIVGITFATIPLIWNNWDTATQCEFDEIFKPWYMAGVITPGFSMVWVCMLIVYLRIWREATKHAKQLRSSFTGLHETPSDSKSVQVVLFILGCFSFCWLPYFIIACVQIFKYVDKSTPMLYKAAFSLAMANSGMNPIIYAWKNTGFRRAFARLLRCQSPDYNDASHNSIKSLNKRRTSSASQNQQKSRQQQQQQQQNQKSIDNTIVLDSTSSNIKMNDDNKICSSSLHGSSLSITTNPILVHNKRNGFLHNNKTAATTTTISTINSTSSQPTIISNNKFISDGDKCYQQNKSNNSTYNTTSSSTVIGNKVRKSSLKRTESSDDDRMSTPHGVFPRKTSFGTVTTTIINTSTDDDDGDYEYSYHKIGHDNTIGINNSSIGGGSGNNTVGTVGGHHNILMSTIVSLDDISLVAATTKSSSASSCTILDGAPSSDTTNDSKIDAYHIIKNQKQDIKQNQHSQQQQQQQKLTKCIASIRNVDEMFKIPKNNIGNGCNSSGGSYREGFIIENYECDGNGNNTHTKCVCVLNPKELKLKLKNLNEIYNSSNNGGSNCSNNKSISNSCSRSSTTSNLSNKSYSNSSSRSGGGIINDVKIHSSNKKIQIKTIENPIENCSSNKIEDKDFSKQQQQQPSRVKINNGISNESQKSINSCCNSKTNVQKSNRKKICNGNHVINGKKNML